MGFPSVPARYTAVGSLQLANIAWCRQHPVAQTLVHCRMESAHEHRLPDWKTPASDGNRRNVHREVFPYHGEGHRGTHED